MSDPISQTRYGDAPLSSAKNPDARGEFPFEAKDDDTLVGRTVTINRPRQELYAFWRDFRNLPLFMENIQSVTVLDDARSHWVVRAPADRTVEWDAKITDDEPGSFIAWESSGTGGRTALMPVGLSAASAPRVHSTPIIAAARHVRRSST